MTSTTPGSTARAPGPWKIAAIAALGWTTIGLLSSAAAYASWVREELDVSFPVAVLLNLPTWLFWAAVTPAIVWLARRWPPRWRLGAMLPHLLAVVVLAVALSALVAFVNASVNPFREPVRFGPTFIGYLTNRWQYALLIYAGTLGTWTAWDAWQRLAERELHAAQLEAQLAGARLDALRRQLDPHFLFNTLQTVSALVPEDPRAAQRTLALLGDLLRTVLEGGGRQEIPLDQELSFLDRYLEIERTRFPDRLRVRLAIDDRARALLVPPFLLQPLVENAVRYAVAPRSEEAHIEVEVVVDRDRLQLAVRDDGPGPAPDATEGVGLRATRARLDTLYGADHRFVLRRRPEGGAEALIELPARAT
jgi:two-component system, LytTR family, sensor kinase